MKKLLLSLLLALQLVLLAKKKKPLKTVFRMRNGLVNLMQA